MMKTDFKSVDEYIASQPESVYPATAQLVTVFKDDLAPYEFNNEGTIRFPLAQPIPVRLIARIAKVRAKEVTALSTGKPVASKK